MATISDIRSGFYLVHNGEPYVVVDTDFIKMAQSGGIMRTTIRNLVNGNVLKVTYKGGETVEEADITRGKANFLYSDGESSHFMDSSSFEQFFMPLVALGDNVKFMTENLEVDVILFNGNAVNVELPKKVTLKVTETEPAVRGNTAQGSVFKPAKLETGTEIQVPLFVKTGDSVVINTERGEYVERA